MIRFMDGRAPDEAPDRGSGDDTPTPGLSADRRRMEALGDKIATLAARVYAATYHLLVWIREFDELFERCGGDTGFRTAADWLAWRTGMSRSASKERVRVARALAGLPLVSRAMEEGRLSFSKVRAIARLGPLDREAEERVLEYALAGTACHLERLVRSWRRLGRVTAEDEERERHERRHLVLFPDDDGSWVVRGRLDPEVGAMLSKALDMAADALYREEHGAEPRAASDPAGRSGMDHGQRLADAIGLASELALSAGTAKDRRKEGPGGAAAGEAAAEPRVPSTSADRFQVVLHVDLETLAAKRDEAPRGLSPSHFAFLDDHVGVSTETARRLCCDAGRVSMLHDGRGNVLDVGRKTRTIPPALARAVDFRDGGRCRFPGCSARGRDRHHVEHWAQGGETRLENLVLLCRFHHRAVHEGGFRVEAHDERGFRVEAHDERGFRVEACGENGFGTQTREGGFRFRRPDGRLLPEVPTTPVVVESGDGGPEDARWWQMGTGPAETGSAEIGSAETGPAETGPEGTGPQGTGPEGTGLEGTLRTEAAGDTIGTAAAGDTIGPWTATPDWDGSPPDYDWMLSGLGRPEDPAA